MVKAILTSSIITKICGICVVFLISAQSASNLGIQNHGKMNSYGSFWRTRISNRTTTQQQLSNHGLSRQSRKVGNDLINLLLYDHGQLTPIPESFKEKPNNTFTTLKPVKHDSVNRNTKSLDEQRFKSEDATRTVKDYTKTTFTNKKTEERVSKPSTTDLKGRKFTLIRAPRISSDVTDNIIYVSSTNSQASIDSVIHEPQVDIVKNKTDAVQLTDGPEGEHITVETSTEIHKTDDTDVYSSRALLNKRISSTAEQDKKMDTSINSSGQISKTVFSEDLSTTEATTGYLLNQETKWSDYTTLISSKASLASETYNTKRNDFVIGSEGLETGSESVLASSEGPTAVEVTPFSAEASQSPFVDWLTNEVDISADLVIPTPFDSNMSVGDQTSSPVDSPTDNRIATSSVKSTSVDESTIIEGEITASFTALNVSTGPLGDLSKTSNITDKALTTDAIEQTGTSTEYNVRGSTSPGYLTTKENAATSAEESRSTKDRFAAKPIDAFQQTNSATGSSSSNFSTKSSPTEVSATKLGTTDGVDFANASTSFHVVTTHSTDYNNLTSSDALYVPGISTNGIISTSTSDNEGVVETVSAEPSTKRQFIAEKATTDVFQQADASTDHATSKPFEKVTLMTGVSTEKISPVDSSTTGNVGLTRTELRTSTYLTGGILNSSEITLVHSFTTKEITSAEVTTTNATKLTFTAEASTTDEIQSPETSSELRTSTHSTDISSNTLRPSTPVGTSNTDEISSGLTSDKPRHLTIIPAIVSESATTGDRFTVEVATTDASKLTFPEEASTTDEIQPTEMSSELTISTHPTDISSTINVSSKTLKPSSSIATLNTEIIFENSSAEDIATHSTITTEVSTAEFFNESTFTTTIGIRTSPPSTGETVTNLSSTDTSTGTIYMETSTKTSSKETVISTTGPISSSSNNTTPMILKPETASEVLQTKQTPTITVSRAITVPSKSTSSTQKATSPEQPDVTTSDEVLITESTTVRGSTNTKNREKSFAVAGMVIGIIVPVVIISIVATFIARRRKCTYVPKFLRPSRTQPSNSMPSKRDINATELTFYVDARDEFEGLYGPVKYSEFTSHVKRLMKDSALLFSQEYTVIREKSPNLPMCNAKLEENRRKNRWVNILPYDAYRVKLLPIADEPCSDYINASYIPGFHSQREYIATQGPLPQTVDDFWRLLWEQDVYVIVMVTQCVERGKKKCEQYWPSDRDPQHYGDLRVTMTSESILSSFSIRVFLLQLGKRERIVKQLHFNKWPDFGCPEDTSSLLNFIKAVHSHTPHFNTGPIVTHCSAGVGRTGTFIALDTLMHQINESNLQSIDVYHTVLRMRMNRLNMVQTEDQYVFIHECIRDYLEEHLNKKTVQKDNYSLYESMSMEIPEDVVSL